MAGTSPAAAWLLAMRPKTLAAGAVPVAVGTALAAPWVPVRWDAAAACLAGALLLQVGCNFANDAFDALKGADTPDRLGPTRAVAAGLITPRAMLAGTAIVLLLALAVGVFLATVAGWPIFAVGVLCLIAAVAYTGGPVPLAYVGLGDVFVFLCFGLVAVLGSAHVQVAAESARLGGLFTGLLDGIGLRLPEHRLLALPVAWWAVAAAVGVQATAILAVNNLRDIATDTVAGKRTLCVRMGDGLSRWYIGALHGLAAALLAMAVPFLPRSQQGALVAAAAVAFIGGQLLTRLVRRSQGAQLNRCLALTAALELLTGVVLVAGLAWR